MSDYETQSNKNHIMATTIYQQVISGFPVNTVRDGHDHKASRLLLLQILQCHQPAGPNMKAAGFENTQAARQ